MQGKYEPSVMLYMCENDKEAHFSEHFLKMITKNRKKDEC